MKTRQSPSLGHGMVMDRRTAIGVTAAGAGLAALGGAYLGGGAADRDGASVSGRGRMPGYFPNPSLVTHEGKRVRFYDDLVRDKTVVFTLMYIGCDDYCPLTTANLIAAKGALGDRVGREVFFYGLTLDPQLDTPPMLKAYAESVGAGEGFTFLTGAPSDMDLVRRKLGLFDPDPAIDADRSAHGAMAVYGNEPKGRWCGLPAMIRPERIAYRIRRIMDI